MCDEEVTKKRIAFQFLEEIKKQFRISYSHLETTAVAFAMQAEFSPVLEYQMKIYNDNKGVDNIEKIKAQIDSVKEVLFCELSIFFLIFFFANRLCVKI